MRNIAFSVLLSLAGCSEAVTPEVAPTAWQYVTNGYGLTTSRMAVPGGWIYREVYSAGQGYSGVALVFVADQSAVEARGEAPR